MWGTIGQAGSTTRVRHSGTIVPLDKTDATALGAVFERLPRFSIEGNALDRAPAHLKLGDIIGEGAMGIVKLADQLAVNREVAVKMVRPEAIKQNAHVELLREGWVTGRLEHPNIVPIYGIGRDSNNMPLLVMKRIEGTTWQALLQYPDHPQIQASGRSAIAYHLGKFIQVCNAVHFAHSRGILHRDLKPENVMIGEFGEVYVLDWGIAVSLDEHTQLPRSRDVTTVAGTPDYMAPEMTTGDGSLLDERTDVFLLGAVLHEILTGLPPNAGDSLFDKIFSAARGDEPEYGPKIVPELGALARKAMAFDPDDRFQGADALRDAVARYMSHISSRELATEAMGRKEAMTYLLQDMPGELDEEEQVQLNNLFSEARFGFKQALRTWPENPLARIGLQSVTETMAKYELRRGASSSAAAVIAELPDARPQLEERLKALRLKKAEEEDRLIRMDLALDASASATLIAAVAAGILFVVLGAGYLALPILDRNNLFDLGPAIMTGLTGGAAGLVGIVWLIGLKQLASRRVARRMVSAVMLLAVGWSSQWLVAFMQDADMHTSMLEALRETASHNMLLGWAALGIAGFSFDSRLLAPGLCYFAGFPIAIMEQRYAIEVFGVASLVAAIAVAVVWRPKLMVEDPDAL